MALGRYTILEEQEAHRAELIKQEAKAEGKSAVALMQEQFEQRECQDPTQFINSIIRLSFQA